MIFPMAAETPADENENRLTKKRGEPDEPGNAFEVRESLIHD